jgi:hypothetical protein
LYVPVKFFAFIFIFKIGHISCLSYRREAIKKECNYNTWDAGGARLYKLRGVCSYSVSLSAELQSYSRLISHVSFVYMRKDEEQMLAATHRPPDVRGVCRNGWCVHPEIAMPIDDQQGFPSGSQAVVDRDHSVDTDSK